MIRPTPSLMLTPALKQWCWALVAVGGISFLGGVLLNSEHTWAYLLLISNYLLGLGLAGLCLVALQYVTSAGWGVALRRVPESMTAILPIGAVALLIVLVAQPSLYEWVGTTAFDGKPGASFKRLWLSRGFFIARAVIYLAVWIGFAFLITRTSRKQDLDGNVACTRRNVGFSALCLVAFGITIWLATYDWIMSLEPEWYSTIFGLYHFSGLFVSGLAAVICLVIWLRRIGPFRDVLTEDHLHDLGKLLFAFSTFWGYIWICQYMLIWYVNIPEETTYFVPRMTGAWQTLFSVNFIVNWAIPFFVLLPRSTKRSARVLVQVSILILIGRWLDLYLMIFPALNDSTSPPMITGWDLGMLLGAGAIFLLVFCRMLEQASLVPVKDPFLVESLPKHHKEEVPRLLTQERDKKSATTVHVTSTVE